MRVLKWVLGSFESFFGALLGRFRGVFTVFSVFLSFSQDVPHIFVLLSYKLHYNQICNSLPSPWDATYTRDISVFMALFNEDESALITACETANAGDQCAISVCKTEMVFTIKIASASSVGKTESSLKHAKGFNPMEGDNCVVKSGVESERSCCGFYPTRFPFKNYGGVNQCCGMKTYDSTVLECCPEEDLKFVGAC